MSSLIERIHGVSDRNGRPQKRPRLEEPTNEDPNAAEKAGTFAGGGKGGVIGDYMRQKKEEGKKEAASMGTVVDLTGGEAGVVLQVWPEYTEMTCAR